MPRISAFYGILIYMYYNEHNPPHFHAHYGENKAVVGINDFALLEGSLPPKAFALVVEWAALHLQELRQNWDKAAAHEQLISIAPLI
ncbi:MAG: DUF4160 domain-containing protein [Chitinophagales bacterium]|nr:DUF4160 domain-containing protein [Chitinophagales bacterium]